MDINIARKLYNSGDDDFKILALKEYNEEELKFPSLEQLQDLFWNNHVNHCVDEYSEIKATVLIAYIHFYMYGLKHNSDDDKYYIAYVNGDYCVTLTSSRRVGCIGFVNASDANKALKLFRAYYNSLIIELYDK